uniref:Ion transport domain-containing protein n=1 Tax=Alexandrium andersonii TaxID=327968 RepID=A0A7S2GPQ5_9DINO
MAIVCFFFSALGTQLWGGLLYRSNPALEGTEYEERSFYVLNFNDVMMSFGVWVVMLLCEYVAVFPDAISRVSVLQGDWLVFLIFYVIGVSIIFELVKAFTIEVFMELRSKWGKPDMQFKTLDTVIAQCHENGKELHSRVSGDLRSKQKIIKMFKKMYYGTDESSDEEDGSSESESEKPKH